MRIEAGTLERHEELGLNHDEEAFHDASADRPEVLLNTGAPDRDKTEVDIVIESRSKF